MQEIRTHRRYMRAKALAADQRNEWGTAAAWRAKLADSDGRPLPDGFPHTDELAAADPPYSSVDDLDGATASELRRLATLTPGQAAKVIAALDAELERWERPSMDFSHASAAQFAALL